MGDSKGFVMPTFFAYAVRPDAVSEVRPVVVTFLQLVPGVFQGFLPGFVPKELPQWRGSNLYTIVEVRFPELRHAQQFIVEILEFLLKI